MCQKKKTKRKLLYVYINLNFINCDCQNLIHQRTTLYSIEVHIRSSSLANGFALSWNRPDVILFKEKLFVTLDYAQS